MSRERILVVEDENHLREVVAYNLTRAGYTVHAAADGSSGLRAALDRKPDLILLDRTLPDIDGLAVCRRVRRSPQIGATAIIMVTARSGEADAAPDCGACADEHVAKPFRIEEIVARVKAVLLRGVQAPEGGPLPPLRRGPLEIDPMRPQVRVDDRAVRFTATEYRLLRCLAERPGRVCDRDALLRCALGGDAVRGDRNIDVHVRAIRKKLGAHRSLIETVRGVGYKFRDGSR